MNIYTKKLYIVEKTCAMNHSVKNKRKDLKSLNRSILRSHLKEAQRDKERMSDSNGWLRFKFKMQVAFEFAIGAFFYIIYILSPKKPFRTYQAAHQGIFPVLDERCSIGLLSDWASYTSESVMMGHLLNRQGCDITIHMGDIYYVGSRKDVLLNFGAEGAWPWGSKGSFAIPGNHEYFSNADGFFKELLPKMGIKDGETHWKQESGFFCLENKYWRIIGLDTGYHSVKDSIIKLTLGQDARLDDQILWWLKEKVKPFAPGDNRGIILLTHHQPKSAFEKTYDRIVQQLIPIFGESRPFIWLWGHEHRLAFYGVDTEKDLLKGFGRCIGHGGMPINLGNTVELDEPKPDRADRQSLIFHDQRSNPRHADLKVQANEVVGYNGYAIIELEQHRAFIRYYDELSEQPLVTETWQVDLEEGSLRGTIDVHESGMSYYKNALAEDAVTIRNL